MVRTKLPYIETQNKCTRKGSKLHKQTHAKNKTVFQSMKRAIRTIIALNRIYEAQNITLSLELFTLRAHLQNLQY